MSANVLTIRNARASRETSVEVVVGKRLRTRYWAGATRDLCIVTRLERVKLVIRGHTARHAQVKSSSGRRWSSAFNSAVSANASTADIEPQRRKRWLRANRRRLLRCDLSGRGRTSSATSADLLSAMNGVGAWRFTAFSSQVAPVPLRPRRAGSSDFSATANQFRNGRRAIGTALAATPSSDDLRPVKLLIGRRRGKLRSR